MVNSGLVYTHTHTHTIQFSPITLDWYHKFESHVTERFEHSGTTNTYAVSHVVWMVPAPVLIKRSEEEGRYYQSNWESKSKRLELRQEKKNVQMPFRQVKQVWSSRLGNHWLVKADTHPKPVRLPQAQSLRTAVLSLMNKMPLCFWQWRWPTWRGPAVSKSRFTIWTHVLHEQVLPRSSSPRA